METQSVLDRPQGGKARYFVLHLFEMMVVMMLGMCVLGATFGELHVLVFGSSFDTAWHEHLGLTEVVMAFNMSLPMVLWMCHRGHDWKRGGEMAAAMSLPVLPLLCLYWTGVINTGSALVLEMALMVPAMLVVMLYRREEYSAPHHRAARLHPRRWFAEARQEPRLARRARRGVTRRNQEDAAARPVALPTYGTGSNRTARRRGRWRGIGPRIVRRSPRAPGWRRRGTSGTRGLTWADIIRVYA